jgi:hypothetical protein
MPELFKQRLIKGDCKKVWREKWINYFAITKSAKFK